MANTQLRAFPALNGAGGLLSFSGLENQRLYLTGGRDVIGDGGGGLYLYDKNSSATGNGTTVEVPTRAQGRLLRQAALVPG